MIGSKRLWNSVRPRTHTHARTSPTHVTFTDDVINLIGPFSPLSTPSLLLTRQLPHLLIHHPDILVSSTKVADSSSCSRKALLQEIIRTVGGSNPSLIYGNMLHEVLQGVLLEGEERKDAVEKAVEGNVGEMWSCELGVERAKEEMMKRSEVFDAFGEMFVGEKPKVRCLGVATSDTKFVTDLCWFRSPTPTLPIQE